MNIRNIAIIAHVDHGKTTLVDALLKQTHTFRENQKEMSQELIMDSNDLEREKGITILSKNTSVFYNDEKINIIDTPGHADFGGEVERVLNMASGAILLVDSAEGPLPQTKFVLKKALEAKLRLILFINKIDKHDARPQEVVSEVENLFLDLAESDDALDFTTLYGVGRDGKVFTELPENYTSDTKGDLSPLFETIIKEVPNAAINLDKPFQMLVSTLDYDTYIGKLCIGKVNQGTMQKGQTISIVKDNQVITNAKVVKLYTSVGLQRQEVESVSSGDIIAIAGITEMTIGQTVTDPSTPVSLPDIQLEEPTLKITIGPNTSPFAGKEGKYTTSRQIKERLLKEKETNIGLKIEQDADATNFVVHGRGELHLSVLIETMRREGFELQVSKPQVLFKTIDGQTHEPFEEVTIDVASDYMGTITEEFGRRKGELLDMNQNAAGTDVRIRYKISSRNLLGIRNVLLTKTRGTAIMNTYFLGYFSKAQGMDSSRNGALISFCTGKTMLYGLLGAQERGTLFIGSGIDVYEGMVIGLSSRDQDLEINVCKEKKLTNNRSSGEGVSESFVPPVQLSLEQALDIIADDELLEVTPLSLRIRKRYLTAVERKRNK